MKHNPQNNTLVRGLTDYLETLQMAGVDAISLDVPDELKRQLVDRAPLPNGPQQDIPQEKTMPKRSENAKLPVTSPSASGLRSNSVS